MKRLYKLIMAGILCSILMSVSACTGSTEESSKPEGSSSAIVAADAKFTGVLKSIDVSGLSIDILDLNYNNDVTIYVGQGTEVYNSDKVLTTINAMEAGMLLTVTYDAKNMNASRIETDEDAWCYDNIVNWSMGEDNSIIKIADRKYKYDSNLVVIDGNSYIDVMNLNQLDRLKVYGIGRKIYSIIVEKGHGYIRPSSYKDFVGGVMYVGHTLNQPVTEDMLVVVPEGTYDVTMRNGDLEGTKQIEINRNQESVLDMSEFRQKPEDKGKVVFDISPFGADLYVNGKLTDYNQPIELNYGKHDVKVELTGYETYSGMLNVKSPNPTVVIDLMEEAADIKEKDDKNGATSSDNTGNNGTGNNDSNSSSSNNSSNNTAATDSNNSTNTQPVATTAPENKTSIDSASTTTTTTDVSKTEVEYDKAHTITVKEPAGTEVYFNGEYKGIAPCSFPKVIGNETITLSSNGYQTKSYTVVIPNDGQDITWNFPALMKSYQ